MNSTTSHHNNSVPTIRIPRVVVAVGALILSGLVVAPVASATHQGSPAASECEVLEAVTAISRTDAWTVGYQTQGQTCIMHWDGTAWGRVTSPNRARALSRLFGVFAVSATDVWAVGEADLRGGAGKTLVEHWDGTQWKIVPSPNAQDDAFTGLKAISGTAADDLWAVGAGDGSGSGTVAEHWDGTAWKIVSTPSPLNFSWFDGVAAIASDDVWAVGELERDSTSGRPLVEHWDGHMWTVVANPQPSGPTSELLSATALATDDVWAVGQRYAGSFATLTEHWNGHKWKIVPSPGGNTQLASVSAVSSTDVWAVGFSLNSTVIIHWDGVKWSSVKGAQPPHKDPFLGGVAKAPGGKAWAVGSFIERWNGHKWKLF